MFRRTLAITTLILALGVGLFLITWDQPAPTQVIEVEIPDERLPR